MKAIFEYDPKTGYVEDSNGMSVFIGIGAKPFEPEKPQAPVLELIKQGVTPDEIIKLKNNDLL